MPRHFAQRPCGWGKSRQDGRSIAGCCLCRGIGRGFSGVPAAFRGNVHSDGAKTGLPTLSCRPAFARSAAFEAAERQRARLPPGYPVARATAGGTDAAGRGLPAVACATGSIEGFWCARGISRHVHSDGAKTGLRHPPARVSRCGPAFARSASLRGRGMGITPAVRARRWRRAPPVPGRRSARAGGSDRWCSGTRSRPGS